MKTYNYWREDNILQTSQVLDLKKIVNLNKRYNKNGDLSSVFIRKVFGNIGLCVFYCNSNSNLDKMDSRSMIDVSEFTNHFL